MINTFEMFWDCYHCGTKKLLGITHRHCPNCGAAQDETKRYFPADGEEVALHNHVYYGVDWDCQYCSTPNSNNSNNCVNCGGPKDGSLEVNLIDTNNKIIKQQQQIVLSSNTNNDIKVIKETVKKTATYSHKTLTNEQEKSSNNANILITLGVLFFIFFIGFLVYGYNHITPTEGTVVSKSWKRTTNIETYKSIHNNDWCSSIPTDAYNISQKKEIKSYDKVKTGEVCSTVKEDNGDGSFSKYRSCEDTYKSVPVYANMCYYSVNRWRYSHSVTSNGTDDNEPHWPSLHNEKINEKEILGNYRARKSNENYSVIFSYLDDEKEKDIQCSYSQKTWSGFQKRSNLILNIRMIGGVSCP